MFVWIDRKGDDPARQERVRAALGSVLAPSDWRWAPPALIAAQAPGPYPTDVWERDGTTAIYWGELYNTDELIAGTDRSDRARRIGPAEVVWHLYQRHGPAFLERLNGQFAIVVWAAQAGRLLAAADRFGTMPLRCYLDEDQFVVATRSDHIRRCPGVRAELDPQAIYDYVAFAMVPAPATIYRNIRKIACREYIEYDGRLNVHEHSGLRFPEDARARREEMYARTLAVIEKAVALRLSDAGERPGLSRPSEAIGAFLSGGLDSSTVLGKMCESFGDGADAFTIGFDEPRFNEMEYARIAARHFGARLHEHFVTPEHTLEAIDRILEQYDEPFGNSSAAAVYHCARFAREHGKATLIAGDGGDEIFAGNPQYLTDKVFETYQHVPWPLRKLLIEPVTFGLPFGDRIRLISRARSYIRRSNTPNPERLFSYGFLETHGPGALFDPGFLREVDPEHVWEVRRRCYRSARAVSEVNRVLFVDLNFVISDSDIRKVTEMSARAGVRVRYPMLDPEVVALAGSLPGRWLLQGYRLRAFYKDAMKGFLPQEIIDKKKHGFGLPFSVWLKTHPALRERMRGAFNDPDAAGIRIFRDGFLDDLVRRHEADETNYYGSIIWVLMILMMWLRQR
jgi:asparagine synthase (glutamine-hydrolysing)